MVQVNARYNQKDLSNRHRFIQIPGDISCRKTFGICTWYLRKFCALIWWHDDIIVANGCTLSLIFVEYVCEIVWH